MSISLRGGFSAGNGAEVRLNLALTGIPGRIETRSKGSERARARKEERAVKRDPDCDDVAGAR